MDSTAKSEQFLKRALNNYNPEGLGRLSVKLSLRFLVSCRPRTFCESAGGPCHKVSH